MAGIENILFFGTPCSFANEVMSHLVEQGYSIAAQVIPGDPNASQPVQSQRPESNIGTGNRLPMAPRAGDSPLALGAYTRIQINHHHHTEVVRTLSDLETDLAVVCCYPRRIPVALIETTRLGGLNVHPSLLPDYRGPDPLFWVFRNGEARTGVSVHQVGESLDSGPLLAQQSIDLPVGTPGDAVWSDSARVGARLLVESIRALERGAEELVPQDESAARYYTWPSGKDLVIRPAEWDAWRVFHFCRGVLPLGHSPLIVQGNSARRVFGAERYQASTGVPQQSAPGSEWIACRTGAVEMRLGTAFF